MKKLLVIALGSAFASMSFGQVLNGGFETGDFTNWTIDAQSAYLAVQTGNPHSGTYAMRVGALTADGDMVHQVVADTNGTNYTLTFWAMQSGGTATNSAVHVLWNGSDVFNGIVGSSMTQYSFSVTGHGSDTLAVGGWNSPAYGYIDDISLSAVPEPASMAILGAGALALIRRRRNKA